MATHEISPNRARKRYLASKQGNEGTDADWTPFRVKEKHFKTKWPKPDLANVLDLATLFEHRTDEVSQSGWTGGSTSARKIATTLPNSYGQNLAFAVPEIPGLVILPEFISHEEQRNLVRWALRDQARHPNKTNLDAHYLLPEQGLWDVYLDSRDHSSKKEYIVEPRPPMEGAIPIPSGPRQLISNPPATLENFETIAAEPKPLPAPSASLKPIKCSALLPKLRWANIGWFYHWGIKQYDFARGKEEVDMKVRAICKNAVNCVDWHDLYKFSRDTQSDWGDCDPDKLSETYEPDAGIVNFYQTKDTLMGHVDRSEVSETSPLVSISLGCACIFLIGGPTRDTEPVPVLLRSGDVLIMTGPCRRAFHGVPRILEQTLPPQFHVDSSHSTVDPEWTTPYVEYLRTTRININVRQVFPVGFKPSLASFTHRD